MIFRIDHLASDTCGNSSTIGQPEYWDAESMLDVWKKLGKPQVHGYWLKDEYVRSVKLVKQTTIGDIWGPNPDCDFERDASQVRSLFTAAANDSAFGSRQIFPIEVKR
jgi:hypothetical protein